jgi:hypothetical protein
MADSGDLDSLPTVNGLKRNRESTMRPIPLNPKMRSDRSSRHSPGGDEQRRPATQQAEGMQAAAPRQQRRDGDRDAP